MKKKDQLKSQIKKLKAEGFSDYDMYAEEFINYFSHYQYRHSFFFKTIKILEFAIINEINNKERFLSHPYTNESNKKTFSKDDMKLFFQNVSNLFKSPGIIDILISKLSSNPEFEQYFAMVFFPTIFIGFSDKIYQDYAKLFLILYYNHKHEFNSLLNQMTSSFILSNFIFRNCLRETFISEWSNRFEQEKMENIIVDSFFKSLSKLTLQQNEILEFYIKNDEKSTINLIINNILTPMINLWEFSPFFASNTILFNYEFPKSDDEALTINHQKCILIENLKEVIQDINQNSENSPHYIYFKHHFTEYLNGYKPSQKIFEVNSILNGEPIHLPISKLDEFISNQIAKLSKSNSNELIEKIDYQDAFLIYNESEFVYDSKYFEFQTDLQFNYSIQKKDFHFSLQDDQQFNEWKRIEERAIAMDENPLKLYKLHYNKDSEKVLEALTFCKEELQHSIDCRTKTSEMMKTADLFFDELKMMKLILRDIIIKFLFIMKPKQFESLDSIMNFLLDELVAITNALIKTYWKDVQEEATKEVIIQFFKNESSESSNSAVKYGFVYHYNHLDPNFLIESLEKNGYTLSSIKPNHFSKILNAFIATLKEFALSSFVVLISFCKLKLAPKGRLSINHNKVTKYVFPQVKEIVKIGSLQLKGISNCENYLSGMRLLAFSWFKKAILDQFNPPSSTSIRNYKLNDFHFVEFEYMNLQIKNKRPEAAKSAIESEIRSENLKTEQSQNEQLNKAPESTVNAKQSNGALNSSANNDQSNEVVDDHLTLSNIKIDSEVKQNTKSNSNASTSNNPNLNNEVIVTPQANVSFNIPLNLNKPVINQKRRFLDEKNAILWDMLDNQHNRMVSICALIARANHIRTSIEKYSYEFKFWMPKSIINCIKQLTIEFGIKEIKHNL